MKSKYLIISLLFLVLFTLSFASANDNVTSQNNLSSDIADTPITGEMENVNESLQIPLNTKIESKDIKTYYKEKSELVSYLKDNNSRPISNKNVSIFINGKTYNKITDNAGKVVLKLNLKPGTYTALIKFEGDDNYTSSSMKSIVKVKKATLTIKTSNFKTYFESGFYFKAKVINKVTKKPVEGVKVAFKVYKNNKYKIYYGTTDENGIAKLRKNFKVGSYKIISSIKNKNIKSKKTKATLKIMQTAEMGCTSLYLQVSDSEAVAGFRRDATNAKTLHIVKYKLQGKWAVKQYKTGSYFFHSITTADGWMIGTGGWDNPTVNHAIETLAGKIAKMGKIKKSYLKKIQKWERKLRLGHFSIKSPDGHYGVVWSDAIYTGKLKPGEYLKAPNARSLFARGNWTTLSKDPAKAAIKVAAKDSFGVNRRDATAFHWKATTTEGKTTSKIKVYAANDNGRLVGKSTGHLKDDIIFKGKFISKNSLPKTPASKYLGAYNMGSIDKFKIQTTVKAPKVTKEVNESRTFDVTIKDKKSKKAIKNLKLKIKVNNKVYSVKTNSKGVAKFNLNSLGQGKYNVLVYSQNNKYYVYTKSTVTIR